jgi:hypothetical protein
MSRIARMALENIPDHLTLRDNGRQTRKTRGGKPGTVHSNTLRDNGRQTRKTRGQPACFLESLLRPGTQESPSLPTGLRAVPVSPNLYGRRCSAALCSRKRPRA